ncbi:MAG: reverse transcriptase domain-containing protein [Nanoarchaeota archaeon]
MVTWLSALNLNNFDDRLNVNGNNFDDNRNDHAFGMALASKMITMKTHNNLYPEIYSMKNLILAWKKARKGKTKKDYVIEFEKNLRNNLRALHYELKYFYYKPELLIKFILRDPKTRQISKSDFRDRIVHHALVRVIEPIFDKTFIYDSCGNRKGKGNLFAIKRFYEFMRKVSRNAKINGWFNDNQVRGYCLKADIKHYFQEINHEILLNIIKRKIKDERIIWLIKRILDNNVQDNSSERQKVEPLATSSKLSQSKGMPLGNLTSQFFANVYLNELDYFVKHVLRAKYYIRYVDDFVLLNSSKEPLISWGEIENFLIKVLKLELHPDKSKITSLSKGVDFVGFRNFYHYRLLRKRNIRNMERKINKFTKGEINKDKMAEIFHGWNAYAKWADSFNLRLKVFEKIYKVL